MQMFVCSDVVYAQNWQVLTLKNFIEALSHASTAYVVASYGPRFFSTVLKKFGQLARIFWANGFPPPLAENCPYAYEATSRREETNANGGTKWRQISKT